MRLERPLGMGKDSCLLFLCEPLRLCVKFVPVQTVA
jgi:hypothetical protein